MNNKLYPCKKCKKEVRIRSKGLCPYCRQLELQKIKKTKVYNPKQSKKNKIKKKIKSEKLKYYFTYHLNKIKQKPYCENCNSKLSCTVSNIAHILPKRDACNPEVMDDINNCLYLCSSFAGDGKGCHDLYDSIQGSKKVYKMDCWDAAVTKFLTFKDKVVYNRYVRIFEEYVVLVNCRECEWTQETEIKDIINKKWTCRRCHSTNN